MTSPLKSLGQFRRHLNGPLSELLRSIAPRCHKGANKEILEQILKIFLSETTSRILKQFRTNVPSLALYLDCSNYFDPLKTWPPGIWLYSTLKYLLFKNHQPDFEILSHKINVPGVNLYQDRRLFKLFRSVKNMEDKGRGRFSLRSGLQHKVMLKLHMDVVKD